jgi:hypothetical protein
VVQVPLLPLQAVSYFFLAGAFFTFFAFSTGLLLRGLGLPHPQVLAMFVTSLP